MTTNQRAGTLLSWSLALLIFSAPLTLKLYVWERPYQSLYFEFTAFIVYLSDIFALLFVLATTMYLAVKRISLRFGPPVMTLPLLLLPFLALLSTHWATDAALAAHAATRLFLLFWLYLAIVNLHPSRTVVQVGIAALILVQGVTAVFQFWQQHNIGLAWLGEIPIEPVGGFSILPANGTLWLRAYGLTPHPNILGGLLAALLILVAVRFLETGGRSRWLSSGTAVPGLAAILFSFSRSAWLGLLLASLILLTCLLVQPDMRLHYLRLTLPLLIIGIVILALFAWTQRGLLLGRLTRPANNQEIRSMSERQALNKISFRLIQENPWQGVGVGQLPYHIDARAIQFPDLQPQPAHNMILLLTAELGIFGGLLWLWLMLTPLIVSAQQWYKAQLDLWTLGLALALLVLAVTDLFDFYSWGWQQGRLLRWLLFGLWAASFYHR